MERKEFLRSLGLAGLGIGTPPLVLAAVGMLSMDIKIYDNYLRGTQHYTLPRHLKHIHVGDTLTLLREKGNQYDAFAIGVEWQAHFLGYIAAYENIVLANLLDQGVVLRAMVTENSSLHDLGIGIWAHMVVETSKISNGIDTTGRADDAVDDYRDGG